MDRFEARDAIVADLKAQGLLVKEEPYAHSVGHCDRCGTVVEPLMSEQWFVAMTQGVRHGADGTPRSLAGDALKAVRRGLDGPDGKTKQIKMVPERHTKVYENWLENIRDWCISRQLWWGHRIPVWYCDACGQMTVAIEDPDAAARTAARPNIRQDEDTLDTWFSSALWPFSTLGWPEQTDDLRYFYPTSVMETGYDIIFLWVARMIMMGIFAMDEVPFEWVYFHGTVRDDQGQRMSKSKGNGVDPEVLDRPLRLGRGALQAGDGRRHRQRPAPRRAAHGGGAQLRQQALERLALRPGAAGAGAARRRRSDPARTRVDAGRGPLDPVAPGAPRRRTPTG